MIEEGDPGHAARAADARMTAEREERKYLVPAGRVAALTTAMGRRLPHHRFTGDGANTLPRPHHFVTTIYFDTPARDQFRAGLADAQHHLRLRAKEYYDLHPSLVELATDPGQIVKPQPVLWLELKTKDGALTGKRRIGIPKRDVPAFFTQGLVTAEMIELQRPLHGGEGEAVLRELAAYCGRYPEPFRADCLVHYRRLPWQDQAGALRVTLDVNLEFYAPPADLWQRDRALVRDTLGTPRGRHPDAVLEVKSRGALPEWLEGLLAGAEARLTAFSKFEEASRAVHGGGV
jgi:hypothetical protein